MKLKEYEHFTIPPEIHIGKLIDKALKQRGMPKAELARRIDTSRQNLNSILQKSHLPCDLLFLIGCVLSVDFFQAYVVHYPESMQPKPDNSDEEPCTTVSLQVKIPTTYPVQHLAQSINETIERFSKENPNIS